MNTDHTSRQHLPTSAQLVKSTLLALVSAAFLLVTVVMPAEYALDPTGVGRLLGLQAMGETKMAAQKQAASNPQRGTEADPKPNAPVSQVPATAAPIQSDRRSDTMTLILKPGEGAEIKLEMVQGAVIDFRWATQGGAVNFDAHGESTSPNRSLSYKKGRGAVSDDGKLEAAFTGQHGWYWKNVSKNNVQVDLSTAGQYQSIKRVL